MLMHHHLSHSLAQFHHLLAKRGGTFFMGISLHPPAFAASSLLKHKYQEIIKTRQTTLPKQAIHMPLLAGREQTTCPVDESTHHSAAKRPWDAMRMSMAPKEGLFTELSLSPPSWMAFGKAAGRMLWQITKGFLQQVSGT